MLLSQGPRDPPRWSYDDDAALRRSKADFRKSRESWERLTGKGLEGAPCIPPPPLEEPPAFAPESPPLRRARTVRGSEEGPLPVDHVESEMAASNQVKTEV